jgi:hypothetical protein
MSLESLRQSISQRDITRKFNVRLTRVGIMVLFVIVVAPWTILTYYYNKMNEGQSKILAIFLSALAIMLIATLAVTIKNDAVENDAHEVTISK